MNNFRGKLGIEDRAFEACESMILARFNMYRTVYWHRTARAMDKILLDALKAVDLYLKKTKDRGLKDIAIEISNLTGVLNFIGLDDSFVFSTIREIFMSDLSAFSEKEFLKTTADRLLLRRPAKLVYKRTERELEKKIAETGIGNLKQAVELWRNKIMEKAQQRDLTIETKDIIIDVPSLSTFPYEARPGKPEDLVFFTRRGIAKEKEKKIIWRPPKNAVILKLDPKQEEVRVYTYCEDYVEPLKKICDQIWRAPSLTSDRETQY